MYVLDTNVLSELRAGKSRIEPAVIQWAQSVPLSRIYLSAITILEIELGIRQLERRKPPQGTVLRAWFNGIPRAFEGRILPFTAEIAMCCAGLHVPDPAPERDAMIAATAMTHGMTLVTRNVVDFTRTGVTLLNPWEPKAAS
ncbi:hypothetical protein VAR608DRAFT_5214 [Variovorax sp. HW608]|nr:hypothetical protein VAR608DRAFT_5214 [Variovorax sp. HW608]